MLGKGVRRVRMVGVKFCHENIKESPVELSFANAILICAYFLREKEKEKENSYRHFLVSTVILSYCYYIVWPKWLNLFYPGPDVKRCKKSIDSFFY